jgi:hypothetical protein
VLVNHRFVARVQQGTQALGGVQVIRRPISTGCSTTTFCSTENVYFLITHAVPFAWVSMPKTLAYCGPVSSTQSTTSAQMPSPANTPASVVASPVHRPSLQRGINLS